MTEPGLSQLSTSPQTNWVLSPLVGIAAFMPLYLIATLLYPGGSQANPQSVGFSWLHNYWCNLFNAEAINGQPNPARPVALLAMLILCISLAAFWYVLPILFTFNKATNMRIRSTGVLSMLLAGLIFTPYHDWFINLAGLVGLVPLVYTFIGLYQQQYKRLLWLGCSCLVLMGANNYIYYTHNHLYWLPSLQKLTLACFLGWVGLVNWSVYKKQHLGFADKLT